MRPRSSRTSRARREAVWGGQSQKKHDLAAVDLDHLDVVDAVWARQERGRQSAAAHDQAEAAVGSHRAVSAMGRRRA